MMPNLTLTQLFASIRGSEALIPHVQVLTHDWPAAVNPLIDRLRADINEWLDRYKASSEP